MPVAQSERHTNLEGSGKVLPLNGFELLLARLLTPKILVEVVPGFREEEIQKKPEVLELLFRYQLLSGGNVTFTKDGEIVSLLIPEDQSEIFEPMFQAMLFALIQDQIEKLTADDESYSSVSSSV